MFGHMSKTANPNQLGPKTGRTILLVAAYTPALFIIGARVAPTSSLGWLLIAGGLIGMASWLGFLLKLPTAPKRRDRLASRVEHLDGQVTAYIASYLLPVLAASSPSAGDVIAYVLCALLILLVAYAADLGAVNPLAYLLGYRVCRAALSGGPTIVLYKGEPPSVGPIEISYRTGIAYIEPMATERDQQ